MLMLSLALLALVACSGEHASPTTSPTPTASPPPTTQASATAALTDARDIDFTEVALLGELIDTFGGGEVDMNRIQYVDLTRDGVDDAFVVVESGGTAGDVGAALITVDAGTATIVGYIRTGGRIEVRFPEVGGGIVVTTEGVWEPGDAECCPANLRESTYEWENGDFVLKDQQVIDNPAVEGSRD